jgi:ABC-type Co2+ transport system permease subunit
MTLPALLAGWLFAALHRLPCLRWPGFRTALVVAGTLIWVLGGVFLVVAIAANRWTELKAADLGPALEVMRHPLTLGAAAVVALLAGWGERHLSAAPEFALGFVVGVAAVLATVTLNALVLLLGGSEDWHQIVVVVVLAHLPFALAEGVVLGFAVAFLARVKPDLMGLVEPAQHHKDSLADPIRNGVPSAHPEGITARTAVRPPVLLLALLTAALTAGPVRAHRLRGDFTVLPGGKVRIESWFDITEESPAGAPVEVLGPNNRVVAAGKTDDHGVFVFEYQKAEPLRVVVSAGAGHRCEIDIPADKLSSAAKPAEAPDPGAPHAGQTRSFADRRSDVSGKDVLLGITFLLALAAFVLSLRNARKLSGRRARQQL